ncbi:MAG TPA: hypothetical protein VHU40_01695 [Polyangia bacterium]|nr:hypothetical protein [Polyangia bacterium]
MSRRFVSRFLLPLVRGGQLAIDRPLSRRGVEALARTDGDGPERAAIASLAAARQGALTALVPAPPLPRLDEATWRLGGAVHNLLALAHPTIARGVGADARLERIAAEATALAALGSPRTLVETLERHSLVARLGEIVRLDRSVRYWLGRQTFIGRAPPSRVLALPRIRAVKVETARRAWLRDIGVPATARPAFLALTEASPLAEALDPLRLDPPPAWGRLLSVLKFPALSRLVAGHLAETGVGLTGDALADALYRFVAHQDAPPYRGPYQATPETVAFALGFLGHLVWLEVAFGDGLETRPERERPLGDLPGRELAVLLAAADQRAPGLLRPPDVSVDSELGRKFERHLEAWFARHDVDKSPRFATALEVAALALAEDVGFGDAAS